jgi:RNA polymerase sigma-70 factor (ECF subfamily)
MRQAAMIANDDERRLVRRLLAGEEAAFDRLFGDLFPRLYRFSLARLHDEEAAAEVAQTALCKLVDHLPDFRGEAPMFTWLCAICRNDIADRLRRRRRAPEVELLEEDPGIRRALEALAGSAETLDPERDLERRRIARFVHAVLDHLPAAYSRALEMRYLDGLGVAEVAAGLGLTYKAAESVLSRARAAFRRGIGALDPAG